MTKQIAKAEVNTFIKGIITEASPLNFPANSSIDEQNFELGWDGTRKRRLGIDLETAYTLFNTEQTRDTLAYNGFSTFNWRGAGGVQDNQFAVVQFANKLFFFRSSKDSISSEGYEDEILLTTFPLNKTYSYAAVDGSLIVAGGAASVATISYKEGAFSVKYDRLKTRDMWGVEVVGSEYETDNLYRGSVVPPQAQLYNLRNQSWAYLRRVSSAWQDPLYTYYTTNSKFPSSSESVWEGMTVNSTTMRESYDAALSADVFGSKTTVSRGAFIIDVLERGISRKEEILKLQANPGGGTLNYLVDTLPQDKTSGGANIVESFAGRVFYAGFDGSITEGDARSPNLSNLIFFSRIIKNQVDISKCYQEGDPSSRELSDIVDTDGGFIRIVGANNIKKLVNISNVLIVLADNGVWLIKGGGEYGFNATNYLVEKLSGFGSDAPNSVVSTGDALFYWSYDGISVVSKDQFGDYKVSNVSAGTIQELVDNVDSEIKKHLVGVYDEFDKTIKWLIKETPAKPYVTELLFNVALSAFTKYKITCIETDVLGYIQTPSFTTSLSEEEVLVGTDSVYSNTELVFADIDQRASSIKSVKYLSLVYDETPSVYFSFAEYKDDTFRDWVSVSEGYDAKAYLLTGAATAGDSGIFKQAPYITTHMIRTEQGVEEVNGELVPKYQSSCKLRTQWEWANTIASKKWSPSFEIYRQRKPILIVDAEDEYDTGFEMVTAKSKLRGRGRAVSLYFETQPLKDCHLVGWNLQVTGNNQ